ncbi:MAG: nitrogen regulation protein NR(II) [Candidatus Bathyarchaeia archaeon]
MTLKQNVIHNSGLITVISLIILTLLLVTFGNNIKLEFNPPYLRLILNTIFISATNIFVAVVSVNSFLRHGQISFAFLSGALVASGLAAFISGGVSGIPTDATFTVFNVGFLISAIMQALGAVYLSAASPASKVYSNRKIVITLMLLAPILILSAVTVLSIFGLTPPFIDLNGNTTDLRQFVIGLSFVFFVFASSVFAYQYFRSKARALYWYALALALFALDTFVSYNSAQLGDLLQWVGRISDYVGGIFFIIALLTLRQQAYVGGSFSERWFETLSNNRAQLGSLFANMLSGFAYLRVVYNANKIGVDAVFLEVNEAFEHNTGLKKNQVLGKRLTEVIKGVEEDPVNWISFFGEIAAKGKPSRTENYMQGLQRWLRISAYSPESGYIVVLIDDITNQRELQKQIEDYMKNLEKTIEERTIELRKSERLAAIGQTAGMVGHDIRNPLQAITGDLFLIEEEIKTNPSCVSREIAESIAAINENISYINKIVSDLQDYTRTLKPTITTVSIKDAINNALSGRKIPDNIQIEVQETDLNIKTDQTFLRRILTNLITNSIQAMPHGGKLTIAVGQEESCACISVSDTGVGISEETKANMFKPLFTTKAKGQGLGLAVVHRLVEMLNGEISFVSETGKGSTFTVKLPLESKEEKFSLR